MSTEQNKAVVRRLYDDVLNGRRIELIDHLVVGDYIDHDPLPGQRDGRPGLVDKVSALAAGLDPRFTIEDVIAEGDRVAVRWINEGTHVAEFLGIPPTGRSFRSPASTSTGWTAACSPSTGTSSTSSRCCSS